jgi:hypothetical protein
VAALTWGPGCITVTPLSVLFICIGFLAVKRWRYKHCMQPCQLLYLHPPFKGDPRETQNLRRRNEIIPAKDSHARIRIKPLTWPAAMATVVHQRPPFKLAPSHAKCPGSGTEAIPSEHSDTRIKPLPLTNVHGRYMTVTPDGRLCPLGLGNGR